MIQSVAKFFADILRFHKLKIFVTLLSALFIGVMIFPYDDLSDVVASKIAQASQNQIYLQFEKMNLYFVPTPGVSMEKVKLDTPVASDIEAGELSLSPSLARLILFKLGFTAKLEEFLNGEMKLSFSSSKSLSETNGSGRYSISGEKLDLSRVAKIANLQVPLKGSIDLEASGDFDTTLQTPAEAEFEMSSPQIQVLPSQFAIPQFGDMNLPGIKLSQLLLKGRLVPQEGSAGRAGQAQSLVLEDIYLGNEKDALSGRLRGRLNLILQARGNQIGAQMTGYDLRVQLTAKPESQRDFGLFLSFLDSHKKSSAAGSVYQFRVAARNAFEPPAISRLDVFQ